MSTASHTATSNLRKMCEGEVHCNNSGVLVLVFSEDKMTRYALLNAIVFTMWDKETWSPLNKREL